VFTPYQQVISRKDQQQYWYRRDKAYQYISANNFAEAFRAFSQLGKELRMPFDRTRCHDAGLRTSKYGISKVELLKACFSREWLIMKRNSSIYIFRLIKVCSRCLQILGPKEIQMLD
jgi:hypothetical protein